MLNLRPIFDDFVKNIHQFVNEHNKEITRPMRSTYKFVNIKDKITIPSEFGDIVIYVQTDQRDYYHRVIVGYIPCGIIYELFPKSNCEKWTYNRHHTIISNRSLLHREMEVQLKNFHVEYDYDDDNRPIIYRAMISYTYTTRCMTCNTTFTNHPELIFETKDKSHLGDNDMKLLRDRFNHDLCQSVYTPATNVLYLPKDYLRSARYDNFVVFCDTRVTRMVFDMIKTLFDREYPNYNLIGSKYREIDLPDTSLKPN